MKKLFLVFLFFSVVTSCKKTDMTVEPVAEHLKLNKRMDVPVPAGPIENAIYAQTYQNLAAAVAVESESLYAKLSNNTATDDEKRKFLADMLTIAFIIYETNPGIENLTVVEQKEKFEAFIDPLGISPTTGLCLAEIAFDFLFGNVKLVKDMGEFARTFIGGNQLQRALLLELGGRIAKNFAKNLPWFKVAIFVIEVANCFMSPIFQDDNDVPPMGMDATNEQEVYSSYLEIFEASNPNLNNLKYFLLQGVPETRSDTISFWNVETQQFDYMIVSAPNPAYYDIFDSTNFLYLKSLVTVNSLSIKAYLDLGPGSLTPLGPQ